MKKHPRPDIPARPLEPAVTATLPAEDLAQPSVQRRDLVTTLFGILGAGAAASVLSACASQNGETADEKIATARAGLEGSVSSFIWVDSIGTTADTSGSGQNLRGTNGSSGAIAIVQGSNAPGDGGGGVFFWDTNSHTDDGGTIIVYNTSAPVPPSTGSSGACWRRIYGGGEVNVRWFGAQGQDTDDTAAIQRAVAVAVAQYTSGALGTSGYGMTVYFPAGVYVCTEPLTLGQGVTVRGDGPSTTQVQSVSPPGRTRGPGRAPLPTERAAAYGTSSSAPARAPRAGISSSSSSGRSP